MECVCGICLAYILLADSGILGLYTHLDSMKAPGGPGTPTLDTETPSPRHLPIIHGQSLQTALEEVRNSNHDLLIPPQAKCRWKAACDKRTWNVCKSWKCIYSRTKKAFCWVAIRVLPGLSSCLPLSPQHIGHCMDCDRTDQISCFGSKQVWSECPWHEPWPAPTPRTPSTYNPGHVCTITLIKGGLSLSIAIYEFKARVAIPWLCSGRKCLYYIPSLGSQFIHWCNKCLLSA